MNRNREMHIPRQYQDSARKVLRDKADRNMHIQRKQIGKGDRERTEGRLIKSASATEQMILRVWCISVTVLAVGCRPGESYSTLSSVGRKSVEMGSNTVL